MSKINNPPKPRSGRKTRKPKPVGAQAGPILKSLYPLDKNPAQMVQAYREKDDQVMKAIKSLDTLVRKKLTRKDVYNVAISKANNAGFNVKNIDELIKQLKESGVDTDNIPRFKLAELVALDDWGTIFQTLKPFILHYGSKALNHLWERYVKPKVQSYLGGDQGFNPIDWPVSVLGPQRMSLSSDMNVLDTRVPHHSFSTSHSLVDPMGIKCLLAPEFCRARYSFIQAQKTALCYTNIEVSVVTSAAGTVGLVYWPDTLTSGSTGYIYNGSDFSVTTGAQTATASPIFGALASVSGFQTIRVTACSLTLVPVSSISTAGAYTLAYHNRSGQQATATSMNMSLSTSKLLPYSTSFNCRTSARYIRVFGSDAEDVLSTFPLTTNQTFYLFGSGLPASTEVCRIIIHTVVEFIPLPAFISICPLAFPQMGPQTEIFESYMFQRCPLLQSLDPEDAKFIIDAIPDEPVEYEVLAKMVQSLVGNIKPRAYFSHTAPMIALPEQELSNLIIE